MFLLQTKCEEELYGSYRPGINTIFYAGDNGVYNTFVGIRQNNYKSNQ
jgi:hypothetical protein